MSKPPPHRIIPSGIPFAQIPHDVCLDGDVTNAAYRVYGFLMKLANTDGRAWPGHRYVADHLPMSRNTVRRAIAVLEHTGWVTVNRRDQAHTYVVHGSLDRLELDYGDDQNRGRNEAGSVMEPEQKRTRTGAESEPQPGQKVSHTDNHDRQPPTDTQGGRRRDLLWEAFCDVHGEPATKGERGKYNRTVAKLREGNVTPDEYPALVAAFSSKHDGLQPAVTTIAERIGELRKYLAVGPVQAPSGDALVEAAKWAALAAEHDDDEDAGRLTG